jgi:DNA polymerase I-like protein with 3'-5' exonuclease and polymerase domains
MTPEYTPFKLLSLPEVHQTIDSNKELHFDVETDDFYGPVMTAQFYQEGWDEVLIVLRPNLEDLMDMLDQFMVVIQFASYEISTIQQQTGTRWIPSNFIDTFFLARLKFFTESSFTLDDIFLYTLGYDPYLGQGMVKKDMQKSDWTGELTEGQLAYAATDVFYMPEVLSKCRKYLDDKNYKLDMITLKHCADWQNNGFPVDHDRRLAMIEKNQIRIDELDVPVNVNSWKQVRPYIGEEESDGLALARYALGGNHKAAEVREARKLLKQNSTLTKKFNSDRIYGKFNPSTRAGRLSCKDQNLQQLFREGKGCFGFKKGDGKVLIYSDFSQMQLRLAAAILGDKVMARLFFDGIDVHDYVKDILFAVQDRGDERQITKTCNFNLLFGGGAGMLGSILLKDANILLPDKTLHNLKRKWRNIWSRISDWQDDCKSDWENGVPDKTPMGRGYVGKMMTDQCCIKIQGGESEVAKIALHRVCTGIKDINDVMLCNMIHDSFLLESPDDPAIYKPVCDIVGNAMTSSWEDMSRYFKIKDLPMPVDVHVGYNWGDIESGAPNLYDVHYDCNFNKEGRG